MTEFLLSFFREKVCIRKQVLQSGFACFFNRLRLILFLVCEKLERDIECFSGGTSRRGKMNTHIFLVVPGIGLLYRPIALYRTHTLYNLEIPG